MIKKESMIKKVAVLTSGGDCPGLNAAIRAVVRTSIFYNLEVLGAIKGFDGLIDENFIPMDAHSVSNILQRGGTILKTTRSSRFLNDDGRKLAFENIKKNNIDALIVIGGDGSFRGMHAFTSQYKVPVIGIPKTIDNDIYGTDFSIGYDSALNTVIQAVDKIRDTANSHDRLFFIEVMGRDRGTIALLSGIGVGAEAILIPETKTKIDQLAEVLERGWKRKKTSCIIIVAEGDDEGGAIAIAKKVKKKFNQYDTRVSILGHMQRGGSPTASDRVLASRLGFAAVEGLVNEKINVMTGIINNEIVFTPFEKVVKEQKQFPLDLLRMAEILSL